MSSRPFWKTGTQATLRGVGKKVFWAYPTFVVQDTADLIAVYMPAGVLGKNVEHRPVPYELLNPENIKIVDSRWERTDVLMLIVPGQAFSVYAMWKTGTKELDCWYINLQEPIRRTGIGFDTYDNMLDVVVSQDMTQWKWKDENEIIEAERIGLFSQKQAREIWAEGEKAVKLLTVEKQSFYEKWRNWQPEPDWKMAQLSPNWDQIELDTVSS